MSNITTRGAPIHGEVEATAVAVNSPADFTILGQFLQSAVDVASASTIALPNLREYFHVTGTTTISAISSTNLQQLAGKSIYFLFSNTLILRHNVTPPLGAFRFLLAAGRDITAGGAGNPLILEFKYDNAQGAMVQVGGDASSGITPGVFGDFNHYIAGLTANAHGSVTAVLVRAFSDNKSNGNFGNVVLTQTDPSGPFTTDHLRYDSGEGLVVQDRHQGWMDGAWSYIANGLIFARSNVVTATLGSGGAANVDGIGYINWEDGSVVTVRIMANVNPVTIRHLASAPINCRRLYLAGQADITVAAGKQISLDFILDSNYAVGGSGPCWVQIGEPPGTGGGSGVASVSAGPGISITGTGTNPIVNNTGVLAVNVGLGLVNTGSSSSPTINQQLLGTVALGGHMLNTGSTRKWFFGGVHAAQAAVYWVDVTMIVAAGATVMDVRGFCAVWGGPAGDVSLDANGSIISGSTLTFTSANVGGGVTLTGIAIPFGMTRLGMSILPTGDTDVGLYYTVSFR